MNEAVITSPLGRLLLNTDGKALVKLEFTELPVSDKRKDTGSDVLASTIRQLQEYFSGERTDFELHLSPEGTRFQKRVWQALRNIPFGQTTTYGQLSEKLGDPKAVRAVGTANGRNPIPIIIPCHRVIGSGQKLTGYSGGIERKRWLLQHEGALLL